MCVLLYFSSLFIIPNSSNIIFSTPNLSWYIWFWHIFIANKWKFSSHFLLTFLLVKQNLDAQLLFTISSLQQYYQYLFPYHLCCFLQLFQITIVVQMTWWQYTTTEQEFYIHQHINTLQYYKTFHDIYADVFKASCIGISGFPIVGRPAPFILRYFLKISPPIKPNALNGAHFLLKWSPTQLKTKSLPIEE